MHHRKRAVARRLGILERRRQRMEIVDLPLGEFGHDLQAPEALELADEVIRQIPKQVLGLAARLSAAARVCLRLQLGAPRPLRAQ